METTHKRECYGTVKLKILKRQIANCFYRVVYYKQLFHNQSFKVFINWHFIAKTMLYYLFTNSTKKSNDKSKFRMALLLPCHSEWLCSFNDSKNGIATEMTIRIALLMQRQSELDCCCHDN